MDGDDLFQLACGRPDVLPRYPPVTEITLGGASEVLLAVTI